MATKQDIEAGIAVHLGGAVPSGHALGPVRAQLLRHPRERQWVIGQVVSSSTKISHPAESRDERAPTLQFVELVGVTDTADCDQLEAMATRIRRGQPGQGELELASVPEDASALTSEQAPGPDEAPDDTGAGEARDGEPDEPDGTETAARPPLAAVPFSGNPDGGGE